jgi:hypothetical protein
MIERIKAGNIECYAGRYFEFCGAYFDQKDCGTYLSKHLQKQPQVFSLYEGFFLMM